jgi:CRISPR-associated protein Cas2
MWSIVMFDLPVGSRKAMKAAQNFRGFLLSEGYFMKQFSVYIKFFDSREKAEAAERRISPQVPEHGQVTNIHITDKQFGLAKNYYGEIKEKNDEKPNQLALF